MKGIIYIRVSSDEQVKGTSLEFQEETCRKYCKDKGIEVVKLFREEGESAKDFKDKNRKQLLDALEFCRKNKGKIDAFVVLKVDRFARNTEDHFGIRKILLDYGATLHSVTEPIGNSPTEKFMETVLAGAAEFDNAIRRERAINGMASRIKQGIYPNRPPIGYTCAKHNKHGDKKTVPDEPDKNIFPIIQKGLREYAKGNCTQVELCDLLDEWGLSKYTGKKTYNQKVSFMLGQYLPFYAGILRNPWAQAGEQKEYRGLHKPMITREEMNQIRLVRLGKGITNFKKSRFNPLFPLKRTIVCMECGRPLTGSSPVGNGGPVPYYHCYNKNCLMHGKGIKKDDLEKAFMNYLKKITPTDKFLAPFKAGVIAHWKMEGAQYNEEAEQHEKKLDKLKERKKRISDLREDGSYSKEEYLERKEEIENEIATTKISLSEARIEQFDIEAAVSYAINFIQKIDRQWFDLSPEYRPRFQNLIFPEGIPYSREKGFGTAKLGLIYTMNLDFAMQKSSLVGREGIEPSKACASRFTVCPS